MLWVDCFYRYSQVRPTVLPVLLSTRLLFNTDFSSSLRRCWYAERGAPSDIQCGECRNTKGESSIVSVSLCVSPFIYKLRCEFLCLLSLQSMDYWRIHLWLSIVHRKRIRSVEGIRSPRNWRGNRRMLSTLKLWSWKKSSRKKEKRERARKRVRSLGRL